MPVSNTTLATELSTDPLTRGYSGMTDQGGPMISTRLTKVGIARR